MNNTRNNNSRKLGKSRRKKIPNPRARDLAMLDSAAMDYARMLVDPCHSPLAHPIFPGSDSGYLIRNVSMNTFATGAGLTSGMLNWVPGAINSDDTEILTNSVINAATGVVVATNGSTPGKIFLENNTVGCRCVAACMRISYSGTESARSGRIMYGPTTGALVSPGQNVTPDIFGVQLTNMCRTPVDVVELVWVPGEADFAFCDPTAPTDVTRLESSSGLGLAWSGLPTSSGINVHFTAVYEWKPRQNLGAISPGIALRVKSRNTFDDVVNFIQKYKEPLTKGAMMAGGAIATTFGLMPPQATTGALTIMG